MVCGAQRRGTKLEFRLSSNRVQMEFLEKCFFGAFAVLLSIGWPETGCRRGWPWAESSRVRRCSLGVCVAAVEDMVLMLEGMGSACRNNVWIGCIDVSDQPSEGTGGGYTVRCLASMVGTRCAVLGFESVVTAILSDMVTHPCSMGTRNVLATCIHVFTTAAPDCPNLHIKLCICCCCIYIYSVNCCYAQALKLLRGW